MEDFGFFLVEPVFRHFGNDLLGQFFQFHHVVLMFRFHYFLMSYIRRVRRRFPAFRQRLARVALSHRLISSRLRHVKLRLIVTGFTQVLSESAGEVLACHGVVLGDFLQRNG